MGYLSGMTTRPIAVLFDLDGTVIDSIELIVNSARSAFAKLNQEWPSDATWKAGIGTLLRAQFDDYVTDDVSTDDFLLAYREYQFANHDRLVRSYQGIAEVVAALALRDHPLAIVTSKRDDLARRGLQLVGLLDAFATVVGCDSTLRHKPDPEPVLLALDRLGYQPDQAVFIGDSVHDIEAGNAAGVTTIGVLWGPFTRAQLEQFRTRLHR